MWMSVHLVLCTLRRRAFSTPAHIRNRERERKKEREKECEKKWEAQRLYVHNTYIQSIHQLGVKREWKRKRKSVHLTWARWCKVDIYLKVLLISVCLEINVYVIYSIWRDAFRASGKWRKTWRGFLTQGLSRRIWDETGARGDKTHGLLFTRIRRCAL